MVGTDFRVLRGLGATGRACEAVQVVWRVAIAIPQRPLKRTADTKSKTNPVRHFKSDSSNINFITKIKILSCLIFTNTEFHFMPVFSYKKKKFYVLIKNLKICPVCHHLNYTFPCFV